MTPPQVSGDGTQTQLGLYSVDSDLDSDSSTGDSRIDSDSRFTDSTTTLANGS